ncbi:hypothetical protein Micbo1qcDRAFT_235473 [Microdochium bolleyi]|uniref:Heterokaryon incompatibility domain-containing protein n=1 Tax=Microdochium bolleyi TaxID=196109 RepID=A0A136IWJ2_9PEZI|nr:hypothetical protein Micbo1qcDRAFT_235473 [Microdochium bolleyi]
MAISHVWAHGQGGRPEHKLRVGEEVGGMNECLHRRYASIAERMGCDSYWMDTPCIPEDKELRSEAIRGINDVFINSKLSLVCDKDLMSIDVSSVSGPDAIDGTYSAAGILARECLLATLLVSDWSVRAWTLLEAMKGRNNIYILCGNNTVLPLKDTLEIVCHYGAVDIAILYATAQHLLPSRPAGHAAGDRDLIKRGLVSVEEAGSLLSHRHASRDGDDIIIWSMLFNETPSMTAEEMWLDPKYPHAATGVNSGFLVSSAPRIKGSKGLSWAPSRAAIRLTPSDRSRGQQAHQAIAAFNTSLCEITPEGLQGSWYIHKFPSDATSAVPAQGQSQLREITDLYLKGYGVGALLRPITLDHHQQTTPATLQGNAAASVVLAICGRRDDACSWEWRGVFEWDTKEEVPEMARELILIA